MRHSKNTIKEANALIESMRKAGVPAFDVNKFGLRGRELVQDMVNKAKRHHTLQERFCSEDMPERIRKHCEAKEAGLEADIRAIAAGFGLKVKFDGDPRGFTVKLHAPKGTVWDTWGGAETGYGIGESNE
jgi:hypothetical protein